MGPHRAFIGPIRFARAVPKLIAGLNSDSRLNTTSAVHQFGNYTLRRAAPPALTRIFRLACFQFQFASTRTNSSTAVTSFMSMVATCFLLVSPMMFNFNFPLRTEEASHSFNNSHSHSQPSLGAPYLCSGGVPVFLSLHHAIDVMLEVRI